MVMRVGNRYGGKANFHGNESIKKPKGQGVVHVVQMYILHRSK